MDFLLLRFTRFQVILLKSVNVSRVYARFNGELVSSSELLWTSRQCGSVVERSIAVPNVAGSSQAVVRVSLVSATRATGFYELLAVISGP